MTTPQNIKKELIILYKIISKLANNADKLKLKKIANLCDALILKRSQQMHDKWNKENRTQIADVTIQSLIQQTNDGEELTSETQDLLRNLARVKAKVKGIKKQDNELLPIEELGGFETFDGEVETDNPANIIWSLIRLQCSEEILHSFFKQNKSLRLRDERDWSDFKRYHLKKIWILFKETFGNLYKDYLWRAGILASRIYTDNIIKLQTPEAVYTNLKSLFHDCGHGHSVIFGTSSILPNPLERYGTDWFNSRYRINSRDKIYGEASLKNPFRPIACSHGLLDKSAPCERSYIWDFSNTARSLRAAYSQVPSDTRSLFIEDSIDLLTDCFAFEKLRIMELASFDNWMKRLSINTPNSVLISFRGARSKRISHAIRINFQKAHQRHLLYRSINIIGTTSSLLLDPKVGATLGLVFGLEETIYGVIESNLFKRESGWNFANPQLREIKAFGVVGSRKSERRRIAGKIIDRLLANKFDVE